jgi:hypothetical protein
MMRLCGSKSAPEHLVGEEYLQPRGRSRASDAHVGSSRSQRTNTKKLSMQQGFNVLNLSDIYMNQPDSTLCTLRWDVSPEFLDANLQTLFRQAEGSNIKLWVAQQAVDLQLIRNIYTECYKQSGSASQWCKHFFKGCWIVCV